MQEHKFRGKRIANGEWVYGYYSSKCYIAEEVTNQFGDIEVRDIEIHPETVGRFTGLEDNNGKEIYEGDIVTDGEPCVVVFGDYTATTQYEIPNSSHSYTVAYIGFHLKPFKKPYDGETFELSRGDNVRVIGNTHENINVLKDKQ